MINPPTNSPQTSGFRLIPAWKYRPSLRLIPHWTRLQFDHASAQREDAYGGVTLVVQAGTGLEFQIVNGRVNQAEVVFSQIGEQHHIAYRAIATVGGSSPSGLGFDGDH
jgi:hypothetical protein